MEFVIGFCGALACLAVYGLGAASGWALRRLVSRPPAPASAPPSDAEDDAFRRLQNYTVEDAYGQNEREEGGFPYV